LLPQEALTDAAVWYTQLDAFDKGQILETRLFAASPQPSNTQPKACTFLDELAASTPAPGGGSAAAYAAAMGAGLVAMVAGLTIGKKKYAEVEAEMQAIRVVAENLREELTQNVEDDAAAFEAVMGAFKLPKDTPELEAARTAAIELATLNAAHIPLHVAAHAAKVIELAARCAESGNLNAISDAASGAAMARAGLTAAAYNVRINIKSLPNPSIGANLLDELKKHEARADEHEAKLSELMKTRGGIGA
jgi:glutamate formiminotransferase/formiminotetrahydrofolate cyclodeaminase